MATATLGKCFETFNLSSVDELITMMEQTIGYLEKANSSNYGDFTDAGKIVNAGYDNYTLYWKYYKELGYGSLQQSAYCAGYVSVMFASAFGLDTAKALFCKDLYVYCPTGYNQFNAKGRIYTTPKKGDIVFFWSSSLGRWSHTGFVVAVDTNGKGYTTIEANTSSGNDIVVRNGGATCRKHYTLGATKEAFGRPPYSDYGITMETKSDVVEYAVKTGAKGLVIKADKINVRTVPGSTAASTIKKQLSGSDTFFPTSKCFINGTPWLYDPNHGWMSAMYVEGWLQEVTCDNKWWYVMKDYTYPVGQIMVIDGLPYYFDDAGYMFIGTIKITTDENGALKSVENKEEEEG